MQSNSFSQSRPKVPRLYHRKSKSGCIRCRARRVKCDEIKPVCNKCSIHDQPCIYDRLNPALFAPEPFIEKGVLLQDYETNLPSLCHPTSISNEHQAILSENSRRKLEFRLLHHYIINTSQTFAACHNAEVRNAWSIAVPKIALDHDNLLYAVFSIAALHLLRENPNDEELQQARDHYQSLALQEQGKAIALLSIQNADAVCFTSVILLVDSFATLQDRILEPWTSPSQWIQMSRGVGSVFSVAWHSLPDRKAAQVMVIVNAKPVLDDSRILFSASNREDLLGLLSQNLSDSDQPWDLETQIAYEQTLSYIGSIRHAIINEEHIFAICRRLCAFTLLIPKKFFEFVEEGRPRALIVLGYYFGCASQMKGVWWLENVAKNEIRGIWKVMPSEWKGMMNWPMAQVGLDKSSCIEDEIRINS